MVSDDDDAHQTALKVLFCGGIAGIATWASVFPLDMIKTRLQAQTMGDRSPAGTSQGARQPLLGAHNRQTLGSFQIAKEAYRTEGLSAFYRGLGVCSVRAFIVNAVQVCLAFPSTLVQLLTAYSGHRTNGS
jgi:solute carrier family 25 carnitine/acylcarnitine transporter 20/29